MINKTISNSNQNNLAFFGLLLYIVLFYSQPGGRFPFLSPLRLELIVGSLMVLFAVKQILSGTINLQGNKLHKAIVFFFIFLVLTIPFAFVITNALNSTIRVFKLFAVYLMIISIINNEKQLKIFIYVYLGLICLIFIQPLLTSNFIYNNHMMRLAGLTNFFAHPNQLGMITAGHIPFFYYLMLHTKSKINKIGLFIILLMAIRVVMLTQSRTAMLGVLIAGFFIWLFSPHKMYLVFVAIMCLIVLWHFMPQKSKERFLTFSRAGDVISGENMNLSEDDSKKFGSMISRWKLMIDSMIIFSEHPVKGLGLGCYISYSGRKFHKWKPPHNTYAQALAEFGIIGFAALALIIYYTLKNLLQAKKYFVEMNDKNFFGYIIITPLTIYYLVYLFISFFGIEIYYNFWWVVGGLSVVILRNAEDNYLDYINNQPEELT